MDQPYANSIREVDLATLDSNLDEYVAELLTGSGALVIRQGFAADVIADARALIMEHSSDEGAKVTHFQGANVDRLSLQRRVWNLLNKGEVFETMAQHPAVMKIVGAFLGSEFHMGSIAANRLLPGGPGQEPHIDYPYWDLYKRESFPANVNSSIPLNCQATVVLDPFTEQTGATAFVPYSQGDLRYPDDQELFDAKAIRQLGDPGDIVIFNGMCWHCAMPNHSEQDRSGVLLEYLPKFVIQLEDLPNIVEAEVVARATPMLRQLIGVDAPYPQNLDAAAAVNAEGRN